MITGVNVSQQNYSTKICGVDNSSGLKTCLAVYIRCCFHIEIFHMHYFLSVVYVSDGHIGPLRHVSLFHQ